MAKLKLTLHDIYNRGDSIEKELNRVMHEAVEKRIKLVEIIPGKGSGQLKKKVLRFLTRNTLKICIIVSKKTTRILAVYCSFSA